MKKIFFIFKTVFLSLAFVSSSWAIIKQSNTISTILDNVTPNTLVLLDIDNTILQPKQTLGSDQWYSNMVKVFKQTMPDAKAKTRAIAIWQRIQNKIEVVPMESTTIEVIKKLQKDNIRVMALTARSKPVVDRTIELLAELGLDFSINNTEFNNVKLYPKHDVKIKKGIIFIGPLNNKGKVLLRFLEKTSLKPEKIIFVDDKAEHTQSVDAALNSIGMDHLVIRYGAADKRVASFSKKIADKQLDIFNRCNKIVSDQYAVKNANIKVKCSQLSAAAVAE